MQCKVLTFDIIYGIIFTGMGMLWRQDVMFLTGYHGTSLENGHKIIENQQFNISDGKKEWLGKGIYFYFSFTDAYNWRDSDAIIHSVIKIGEDEYLDIDSKEGERIYNGILDVISSVQSKTIYSNASPQENQCAVMKMIWGQQPKIKVISASFATEPTKIRTLIDKRPRRKEFCVRNNDCIKHSYLIGKGDLND